MQNQPPSDIKVIQFTMEPLSGGMREMLALSQEPDAEPPAPPDAPVQDILFQPPRLDESKPSAEEEPLVLSFVMSDPHVEIRMRNAVRDAYAIYGNEGLESLEAGLLGNARLTWKLRGEPYHHLDNEPMEFVWSDSEKKLVPQFLYTKAPLRGRLIEQYQRERKLLEEMLKKTLTAIERAAVEVAEERLEKSKRQVVSEIKRYVDLIANDANAVAALNDNSLAYLLTGKDIIPLASSFLRIDEGRGPIRDAQERYKRVASPVNRKRAEWMQPEIEALSDHDALVAQKLIDIGRRAQEAFPDTPEMIEAQNAIAEAQAEFATLVAIEALKFPILYRLWNSPTPQVILDALSRFRSTNTITDARALAVSLEFRDAILTTLRRTWGAANRTLERIRENDLNVWRYPPMVTAALNRLALPPGTVEWMAANDRVEQEAESISLASALSMSAGLAEWALAGVAPPVAAALAVINLLLSVWEFVTDLLQKLEEQDAFDASLNPALSFAAEPSYIGLLVGLAFLALQVRDAGKTVTKAGATVGKGALAQ